MATLFVVRRSTGVAEGYSSAGPAVSWRAVDLGHRLGSAVGLGYRGRPKVSVRSSGTAVVLRRAAAGEGAQLLFTSFEESADPEAVVSVRTFTAHGISTLESLAGSVPADAQDELADAAILLQGIDQEAGRPLDRDRDHLRRAVLLQARHQCRQTRPVVADLEPVEHHALGVDHADGVGAGAPVDADPDPHRLVSSVWRMIPIAGSPGGMLIDRRSGRQPTARLPVARRGLPAAVAPLVSCGPSKGERDRRSRRRHGTSAPKLAPQATLTTQVAQ